jgi:hypothetical protein
VDAGLCCEQEECAAPDGLRPQHKRRHQAASVGDAARGDDRAGADGVDDLRHERQRADGANMAAGFAANIGPQDIALTLNQGVKGIIAIAGTASGGNCLAVRNGVTIDNRQQLKGKTICIGAGSISWLMFATSVAENDIDYNALKIVDIIGSGITFTKAMEDKQIDMMIAWQPFCAQAVLGGYGTYPGIDHCC